MKKRQKQKELTTADFFAGIGGFRMGFEKAGYRTVYANDFDTNSCKTYRENFGEIDEKDIQEIDIHAIPNFDVLLGGFPCQPFSMAGKRQGLDDPRGKLIYTVLNILNEKYPKAFVLENVKPLLNFKGGEVFKKIKLDLENTGDGYNVTAKVLNSANFGLPQKRERLYIVGIQKSFGEFKMPESLNIELPSVSSVLEKGVPEKYYLTEKSYRGLLSHKERHKKNGNGFGCKILSPDEPANTLVSGNMGRERNLIKDIPTSKNRWGIRKLTERECARLQGFPDDFIIPVAMTQAYKQFGNAVSVPVAQEIAKGLKKHLA